MVTMLHAESTLAAIAAHFGVDVKEVEQAIQREAKSERNQADE
jgi:predicted DsbA family dithiol-disulfide isomerase